MAQDFFQNNQLDKDQAQKILDETLNGAEDGELFLEKSHAESIVIDDGHIKQASFDEGSGFGLRAVSRECTGFAHSTDLSKRGLERASDIVRFALKGYDTPKTKAENPKRTNQKLYPSDDPLGGQGFPERLKILRAIDEYARKKEPLVKQVSASLGAQLQDVCIMRTGGEIVFDTRPLVRLSVQIVVERNGRQESGMSGGGGRAALLDIVSDEFWRTHTDEAIRQALVNLDSVAAPAGEQDVVLGNGWPGILLHEAIGHGLEGDFHRKKTSAFSGLLGQRIAAKGVTVVDDGTLEGRRGSLSVDDEGTPTQRNVLIEDGIFKGILQDRMNARLMGQKPTGNGRRQAYNYQPMPRMTNTFMLAGNIERDEIIASVKRGIYAPFFGGGQVDITNGKFVFSCTEAYRIENGRLGAPLKGAMLIGHGPEALKKTTMVGNDMALDSGIGVCGKDGQGVPVGVGQPTLRLNGITVGGSEVA